MDRFNRITKILLCIFLKKNSEQDLDQVQELVQYIHKAYIENRGCKTFSHDDVLHSLSQCIAGHRPLSVCATAHCWANGHNHR